MDLVSAKRIEGNLSIDFSVDKLSGSDIKELKIIGTDLIKFCRARVGLGLSACQVGMFKSLFVWYSNSWEIVINPQCWKGTKPVMIIERCMSYPRKQFKVQRFKNRFVSYYIITDDNKLKRMGRELRSLPAYIFQHETDHTLGITIKMIGQEVK